MRKIKGQVFCFDKILGRHFGFDKFWAVVMVLTNFAPGSFYLLVCLLFFFTCSVSRIVYKRKPTADPPPSSVSGLHPTSLPNFPFVNFAM
jgi:hypothetical protein